MAMLTVQVKLPEETIKQIDELRGQEMGWAQSAVVRRLIDEALARRFSLPQRSVNKTASAPADQQPA